MITINSVGLDKVIADLESKKIKFEQEIKNELIATIYDIQRDAKQLVQSQSSDTSNLANSIEVDTTKRYQVSIFSKVEYAAYIEFGTRKFAQSYVSTLPSDWQRFAAQFKGKTTNGSFYDMVIKLVAWAQRTGKIDPKNAYSLAKKILIQGIKPRPFLYPSVNQNFPKLINNLKQIFK